MAKLREGAKTMQSIGVVETLYTKTNSDGKAVIPQRQMGTLQYANCCIKSGSFIQG